MRYVSLIIGFLIVLFVTILGVQNDVSVSLKFISWKFTVSLPVIILISTVLGVVLLAIFTLPKIIKNHFKNKKLQKEIKSLENEKSELELKISEAKQSTDSLDENQQEDEQHNIN